MTRLCRPSPWQAWPLFSQAATQRLEQHASANLPAHTLMERAGLSAAQLALALAPHAQTIWLACGPGNNGGDGAIAARHLHQWGKKVVLTRVLGTRTPPDAAHAWQQALASGLTLADHAPSEYDLAIDALLGLGSARPLDGVLAGHAAQLNRGTAPVLALDLPSGLMSDTGVLQRHGVRAHWTLALLTLKPGLFTASGRDASGALWFDDLGVSGAQASPSACLNAAPPPLPRPHASHKGSYGDVAVLGGAPGMAGAAQLAASAALHAGAGRVYLCLLDSQAPCVLSSQPELMLRPHETLDYTTMTVVAGCGGADAIRAPLPRAIASAQRLVLDADALNAIASDPTLAQLLRRRSSSHPDTTLLTPHPLEAARLLGVDTQAVQHGRLAAAQTLSAMFAATVVLKGSGSVCAAPGQTPTINPSGNARLACAGTGDVLAGWLAAALAHGLAPFAAAQRCVYAHGAAADHWPHSEPLTAAALARAATL